MARSKKYLDLMHRFAFHPATAKTGPAHDKVRTKHALLASWVLQNVPEGRHQSLALTALQESMMWCNAAIACDTQGDDDTPQRNPHSGPSK